MGDNNSVNQNPTMQEVTALIKQWEDKHLEANYDPIPTLTRLSEICEVETETYLSMDPDPFDERHPSRTDPEGKLGQILKALFRKDNFMNKLVNDYLRDTYYSRLGVTGKSVDELNIAACRMMLDVMPGLETSVVFQPDMDSLIHRLIKWTTNSIEPLQSYATGLLAAAMEIPEIAARFRDANGKLIPLLLQRLHRLQSTSDFIVPNNPRPFAHLSGMKSPPYRGDGVIKITPSPQGAKRAHENGVAGDDISPMKSQPGSADNVVDGPTEGSQKKKRKLDVDASPQKAIVFTESSNSSWAELKTFMIGSVRIFPPTKALRQILILRYLSPMGEYQEFLSHVFENDAISLILNYVNVRVTKEARLAFEALRYLAALLCHKKFSIEFLNVDGLEALLEVPRPSIAATGVSICLYYLGYCEDAMERVCLLPKYIINSLVKYALWLLECSHDSGRCHAIMFFSSTFQFKVILDEFDSQDGLRRLHNVIATLPILFQYAEDAPALNDDVEAAARQIMRHVCVAYRRYLEAHLALKIEPIRRSQIRSTGASSQLPSQPNYKACKFSPEEIQEQIETLLVNLPFRCHWAPVDHLLKLGGLSLLLKIIGFSYEWNYSGRAETVRSALDVLAIACVMPKVQLLICDRVPYRPEDTPAVGMNIILGAAEGEIVTDADVQKAALRVIVNCVCAPIMRVGGTVARFSTSVNSPTKKIKFKSSEELIQKVWDCVRSNNGIMVLLTLMNVKTPITDADSIRTLACKALAGLARSETVRQIVSKLPLFTSGQLQTLMRDPILQEKRQEHVSFQKYALELLERLSGQGHGKSGKDLEVSLSDIHRANVVAQTKIQFNERQVLQLIHQHLVQKGYSDTASTLVKEANLSNAICQISSTQQPTKFRYTSTLTPSRVKLSFSSPMHHRALPSPSIQPETTNGASFSSPAIKIIKKNQTPVPTTPVHQNSRLQKQTSSESFTRVTSQNILEEQNPVVEQPRVSLDSIITEYLTNQHALCKNPMANCPQFNLFIPHKCPDPKPRINTANNFIVRCARRAIGYPCKNMNRKYVHSRFCPVQSIRQTSQDSGFFTVTKFLPDNKSILVGDYNGEVRIFNLNSGNEELMFQAHDNYVVHVEPNRTGEFLLTSSTWGRPLSAMWNLKTLDMSVAFQDEDHVEYSKLTQDKILATKLESAIIYDVATGLATMTLSPEGSNQYTKNRATFSPFDDLVLTDGVLFDVASGKQIHKLDKLNQTQSGVFHPNGLEIVSNSEVWDIRTFHLLKTVPALNQCNVTFAPYNSAIYAISMEQELDDGDTTFDSSFKTLDAYDYSSIATIDVKRNIYDLAVNKCDTLIAIVENQGVYQSVQESVVRLYDVGRRRDDEDELEDEDEDDEEMNNESDDDNSDNDDPMVIDLTARRARNRDEDNGNDDDSDISAITSDSDTSWTSVSSDSLSDEY